MLRPRSLLRAPLLLALASACSAHPNPAPDVVAQDAVVDTAPSGMPVTVQFRAMVGALPFACSQVFHGLGTTMTDWHPGDFRFYVHNVRLLDASGNEAPVTLTEDGLWQHLGVALLDFEDKTGTCTVGTTQTNDHLTGYVAPGTYTGVRFDLGVPFEQDHQDVSVADPPLDISGMFWSWEGGYRFLKIEGSTTGVPGGFNVHLGSEGCTSDASGRVTGPCTLPNVTEVTLMGFDAGTQAIVADFALLTSDSNLDVNTMDTPPGCMSASMDPECVPIFAHLDLAYDAAPAPGLQRFFRVQ